MLFQRSNSMKKLLILLGVLGMPFVVMANDIPTGTCLGSLTTTLDGTLTAISCDSNKTNSGLVTVALPVMPHLFNQKGTLTADIALKNTDDCFNGNGKLVLSSGMLLKVTSPSCTFVNNHLSGSYKVENLPFNGTFDFDVTPATAQIANNN